MPNAEPPWPAWTQKEIILSVYHLSRGLEIPDVARLIQHKLHRRPRNVHSFLRKMDRINEEQARKGHPPLCDRGMADWNLHAVDAFLIDLTDNSNLLSDLLWFDHRHIRLLHTYRHIPLDDVLDVDDMLYHWANILGKHCSHHGNPWP